ncbi:MAG: DMT family transporter [Alphaproteobacteria bacterium]|nr:DMT family transporter [Alphaproteobacteria bacterium]
MDFKSAAMGISFVLMWSSAFSSARIIVQAAPPLSTLSLRFLITGIIAIAIAKAMGQSMRLTRAQWTSTVVFGICQNGLYLGLFFMAMQWIGAGLASIIASTMPLMVALLSWVFLKERTSVVGTLGLLAGFAGVALIMSGRFDGSGTDLVGLIIASIGVLALAVATLVVRGASSGGNIVMVVGLQMLVGSAVLIGPALMFETVNVTVTPKLLLAFIYTILVPGLAGTWIWFLLVGRIGSTRAATYHFLNPFFGVAIAAALLGEKMSLRDFIGVAIVTVGILAVQLSKRPANPLTSKSS